MSPIVEFIADEPGLAARLLLVHADDGNGRCRGCSVPGYGTPGGRSPCLLAVLARRARLLADERTRARP